VVKTGGDAYEAEREQWDDGNNGRGTRVRSRWRALHDLPDLARTRLLIDER
jgi:hypothetical protein